MTTAADTAPATTPQAAPIAHANSAPPRRIRQEHLTASAFGSAVIAIALTLLQGSSVSGKVDVHAHELATQNGELAKKLDEQTKALTGLDRALIEIKAEGRARDQAADRFAAGLAEVAKELRALEMAGATDREHLHDLDRRLSSSERK